MAITYSSGKITVIGGRDSGAASGGSATTLSDSSKSWPAHVFATRVLFLSSGTGVGQVRTIADNDATQMTVVEPWDTAPDDTTGYIVSFNFNDIQDADSAGSWGKVFTQGNQHRITAEILLGDGSTPTYLADTKKAIEYTAPRMFFRRYATLQFGRINRKKQTSDGCDFNCINFISINNFGQEVQTQNNCGNFKAYASNIYAPTFWCFYSRAIGVQQEDMVVDLVDCNCRAWGRISGRESRLLRVKNYHPDLYGMWTIKAPFGTIEGVSVSQGDSYGFYYYGSYSKDSTVRQLTISDVGNPTFNIAGSGIYTLNLIDCDIENWTFLWDGTHIIDRKYTVNLLITDTDAVPLEGVKITLKNKNGVTLFSERTGPNGMMNEDKEILYARYTKPNGDTPELLGPFDLEIVQGNSTYKTKVKIDSRVRDIIALGGTEFLSLDGIAAAVWGTDDAKKLLEETLGSAIVSSDGLRVTVRKRSDNSISHEFDISADKRSRTPV